MMEQIFSLETSPLRSELRLPRGSVQKKGIHQKSLDYKIYQIRNTSKWSWYFNHKSKDFKAIRELHTRTPKRAKFIQKLHIHWNVASLNNLRHSLKILTSLKHLSLTITGLSFVQSAATGLDYLIEIIEKLSRLESLKLFFDQWTWGTDNDLNYLSKSFRMLNSLKTIVLHFWECPKITDMGIHHLCQNLKNLTLLENINLYLCRCEFITDQALITIKTFLKTLKNLQRVKLYFRLGSKISLAGIEDIIQSFEASKISTYFYSWEIKVKSFTKGSKRFISFHTDFWEKDVMTEYKKLEKILLKLITSQDLSLKFAGGSLHSDLEQICQTLKTLPLLNGLSFKFSAYSHIYDGTLKRIGNSIKHLRHLKYISFEFREQFFTGEKRLRYLYENLEKLHSLETLNLVFSKCYWRESDGLKILSGSLKRMVSLQNISLDFSGCDKIRDSWLENIVKSLENLVVLQEFTLRFTPNKKITRFSHEKIVEILKNHQSLKRVTIDYGEDFPKVEIKNDQLQKKKVKQSSGLLNLFGAGVMYCISKMMIKPKKVKDDSPLFLPPKKSERDYFPIGLT